MENNITEKRHIAYQITVDGKLRFRSVKQNPSMLSKGFTRYEDGSIEDLCLAQDFPKSLKKAQEIIINELKSKIKAIENITID